MKERPILFTGPMVRAILDGSKTQTRRIVKPQPFDRSYSRHDHRMAYASGRVADGDEIDGFYAYSTSSGGEWRARCPYGQPGDRLWVRETWLEDPEDDGTWHYTQYMGCKGSPLSEIPKKFRKPEHCIYREGWDGVDLRWRPSIHMPRWASRILLEIVSVRVERLQAIGDNDALTEGVERVENNYGNGPAYCDYGMKNQDDTAEWFNSPVDSYQSLWESINGAGSWDANPWVWVVEFKRVAP